MAVRHHIKVLVVDDDPSVCNLVAQVLEDGGYQPLKHTDPAEALKTAENDACQIAIVDLRMPQMDGVKVVERLKAIDERTCCIVMTGYPDLESATATMRQGSADYIIKPFKNADLLASVESACAKLGLIYRCEADLNRLIGQRIRTERQRQNLTLRQVSVRSDLTTSQLSQVELGKNAASLWALARISNSLGMRLSALLQGL
jgi:two-component system OmpR family response regulator